jgi:hypothetical protein
MEKCNCDNDGFGLNVEDDAFFLNIHRSIHRVNRYREYRTTAFHMLNSSGSS